MKVAALLVVSAALAGVSASAGSRSAVLVVHPTSSIALRGGYGRLAADGPRAAAVAPCGIILWTAGKPKGTFVDPCRAARGVDFSGTDEVALAGNRLAWMREEWISHGFVVQTELVVKTGTGKPREISDAVNDNGEGGWLLTLAGDGDTLAFGSTYDSLDVGIPVHEEHVFRIGRASSEPGASRCPHEAEGLLPNPPPAHLCIDTGLQDGSVRSVSQGRILVSFGDGLAGIVEPDNTEHDLPLPETQKHVELAISGKKVVIVRAGGKTLDVYDAESGALRHRWPIARATGLRRLSVAGGFAVFSANGFHLVRLSDGSETTLLAPGGKPPVTATLEPTGLYLLYRTKRHERLGFVQMVRLRTT